VQGKVAANFIDGGEHSLKNIARPVRVYRVELDGNGATQAAAPASILPDKPSIAVLPFQNMSGDSEQDHFCDGLVEDIITTLSKLAELRVTARNSSFVYKGRSVDVHEAAKQLGV
jgi:adenylate cyclase